MNEQKLEGKKDLKKNALSDDQLDQVSGGVYGGHHIKPKPRVIKDELKNSLQSVNGSPLENSQDETTQKYNHLDHPYHH